MKVWTTVNQKGGVGKTTTAVSISGALSELGKRVLLIDADPQASLSHYLRFNELYAARAGESTQDGMSSLFDVFMASESPEMLKKTVQKSILATRIDGVYLIPAHMALATIDDTLGKEQGKGLILKKLTQVLQSHFDYIIIDCPPVLGVLMVNALLAADKVLIPTQTEYLALHGLDGMLDTIEQLNIDKMDKCLIIPSLFDRRVNACLSAFTEIRSRYKPYVWKGYVPMDTKLREASAKGLAVSQVAKKSKSNFAYQKLVNDLLKEEAE